MRQQVGVALLQAMPGEAPVPLGRVCSARVNEPVKQRSQVNRSRQCIVRREAFEISMAKIAAVLSHDGAISREEAA